MPPEPPLYPPATAVPGATLRRGTKYSNADAVATVAAVEVEGTACAENGVALGKQGEGVRTDNVHRCVRADIDAAEIEDGDAVAEDAAVSGESQRVGIEGVSTGTERKNAVRRIRAGVENLRVGGSGTGRKRGAKGAESEKTKRKVGHHSDLFFVRKWAADGLPRSTKAKNAFARAF